MKSIVYYGFFIILIVLAVVNSVFFVFGNMVSFSEPYETIFFSFCIVMMVALLVVMQTFLCKLKTKWFDFVLPFVTLLYSVYSLHETVIMAKAPIPVITAETFSFVRPEIIMPRFILFLSIHFLISNIPTIVMLCIHISFRRKPRQPNQFERRIMNYYDVQSYYDQQLSVNIC